METLPTTFEQPTYPRRRQQFVATALAGGTVVVLLVALLGRYLETRHVLVRSGAWKFYVPLTQPNVMLGTLILASIAMQWAVYSVARNDRLHAYWAFGITALLGGAFLNQTWFLLSLTKLKVATDAIAPSFYATVGLHAAMVVAAMVYLLVTALRVFAGNYNERFPEGVASVALFWQITTGAYALVWYAIYITK